MKTLQITGFEGAYNIGQTLLNRGVQLEFLLDEGLTVVDTTAMDGLTTPAALWVNIWLHVLCLLSSVFVYSYHPYQLEAVT